MRAALAALAVLAAAVAVGFDGARPVDRAARAAADQSASRIGPLRVLRSNRRYFADGSGRAVYLTGSHVWWNLVGGRTWKVSPCRNPVEQFSFSRYLDQLQFYGHNYVRLWTIELPRWEECGETVTVDLQPWVRTGPGLALDGRPRFDLTRPNRAYFRRLADRVRMAERRGIYVSVMLFEGWGLQWHEDWRWRPHPFNRANNVNGIDGDPNGDGTGTETHTLAVPAVTRVQEAYVRRVVDTLNRFDNVLYEIANESGAYSTAWQYRMIDVVDAHQRRKRKRHPVGMTFQHAHGTNRTLFRSRASWVGPAGVEFVSDPPAVESRKVVVSDTDHHCGGCGDHRFPWKSFTRGLNPIHMDLMAPDDQRSHAIRSAMGQTRRYANRIDLARSRPRGDLASTAYALARPGVEYLVYQPERGPFTLDLRNAAATFAVEWFDPAYDRAVGAPPVRGGEVVTLTPPFDGEAVVLLRRQ